MIANSNVLIDKQVVTLSQIAHLNQQLLEQFQDKLNVQPLLSRSLVSFQANKNRPVYRWYRYKEAFSASLVEYLLHRYGIHTGKILDPFAGSGTAMFAASALGLDADGIELLPIGQQIVHTRQILNAEFTPADFARLREWSTSPVWQKSETTACLPELRITQNAYPEETKKEIEQYLGALQNEKPVVRTVLQFALLCVLESISFTRKDGQYLRWDYRSGRRQGTRRFDKGEILAFRQALSTKITEIISDTSPDHQIGLFPAEKYLGDIHLHSGSCLEILPQLPDSSYEAMITSPPYCNRYDYTRTYALELALLGVDEREIVNLRQEMLSSTVENRPKDLLQINSRWRHAVQAADEQELLQAVLAYLEYQKAQRTLNNNGIPRMVRGYFYEMACVIAESARVLQPNAWLFMVNDNVRYAGASISVDLILSDLAEKLGFSVENILVLPNGKGNSSQQMGTHGREALRKCIYVWRKR